MSKKTLASVGATIITAIMAGATGNVLYHAGLSFGEGMLLYWIVFLGLLTQWVACFVTLGGK